MPALSLENFLSWMAQVLLLASIGAILPAIFQIRHPRWHLAYCHALLIACLALPFIQPWQHPFQLQPAGVLEDASAAIFAPGTPNKIPAVLVEEIVFDIFLAGLCLTSCRLLAGLLRLRQYRKTSMPLVPEPEAVLSARRSTHADADVRVSCEDTGPVTFGILRPVVLFPESFLALSEPSQYGIACHEFLHVQRKDWLAAVLEEAAGACLWFHPAIWWILAQAKLAREQIVDQEVIRRTEAREPYIEALLTMAGITPQEGMAAPFLRKRHLARRLKSLLADERISRRRLWTSYVSMTAILVIAGWSVFLSFPLAGRPQTFNLTSRGPTADNSLGSASLSSTSGHGSNTLKIRNSTSAPKRNTAELIAFDNTNLNLPYTDEVEAKMDPPAFAMAPAPIVLDSAPAVAAIPPPEIAVASMDDKIAQTQNLITAPPANYAADRESTRPVVPVHITAPKLISQVLPRYSDRARMARIAGSVVLKAIVRKDGTVKVLGVLNNIGYGLDESAAQAAEQWRFQPATSDGVPVDIALNLEIRFNVR